MILALLAVFWLLVAAFLLLAPQHVLEASPRSRRYGAAGCVIFAAFSVIALVAG